MTSPLVYLNGRFIPFAEAGLPLHDAGFVSGATVVDNARTFRRRLFRWPDHLQRFRRDCTACYIPLEVTDGQLTDAAEELVVANAKLLPPGGELQLVTFATPGPLGFYLGESGHGPGTLGMVTYPVPFDRYRRFFTDGVTLAVAGFQASNPADILPPGVKHRSRMFWHIAEQRLRDPECESSRFGAVPVLLNPHGVGDTAIGSILVVEGETVIRAEWGLVQESISSQVVSELCGILGLEFETAPLDLRSFTRLTDEADFVEELLLTGTGFCLAGVKEFAMGNQSRSYVWPGPVYRRLLAAWGDLVGVDVAAQMTGTV